MEKREVRKLQIARTFVQVSVILLFLGIIVIDPTAGCFFFVVASLLSFVGTLIGSKRLRYISVVVIGIAVLLLAWRLPDAYNHYSNYIAKTLKSSSNNY